MRSPPAWRWRRRRSRWSGSWWCWRSPPPWRSRSWRGWCTLRGRAVVRTSWNRRLAMSVDPGDPGLPRGVVTERAGTRVTGRMIFGLVLVACGLMWTLENLGVPGIGEFTRWWPAALVVYGFVRITGLDGTRRV